MPIFTFKAIIGRFRYQSDCDDDDGGDDDDDDDDDNDMVIVRMMMVVMMVRMMMVIVRMMMVIVRMMMMMVRSMTPGRSALRASPRARIRRSEGTTSCTLEPHLETS